MQQQMRYLVDTQMKRTLEWLVMIGVGCAVVAVAVWSAYHPGRISDQQFFFGVMTLTLVAFLLKEHWRSRRDWRLWPLLALFLGVHAILYPVAIHVLGALISATAHVLRFSALLIFLIFEGAIASVTMETLLQRKASLPHNHKLTADD